jgi:hypothetical protein
MKTQEQIVKIIRDNYLTKTDKEIGVLCGISKDAVRGRRERLGLRKPLDFKTQNIKTEVSITDQIQQDRDKTKGKQSESSLEKKYKRLLENTEELEKKLEILHSAKTIHTYQIKPRANVKSEATAVILASDWHVGETVDPETIGYVNEYNADVAKKRAEQFFANAVRLLQIFQKDVEINHVILALLGDFITNTIHEELAETNSMLPANELSFAQDLICSGIDFILANTSVSLIVPCHSGNHGRMTKKQRISSEAGNSLEYYMYKNIALYFRNNERVQFIIPKGYFSYVEVYDKVLRFHHGHHLSYGGGVGGVTIPINKAIAQWNKIRKVDYDCFGHFHQFLDGGYWLLNGSMIGFNAYAESIKAGFEKPKQTFFLIDKSRGKTVVCPISFDI